MTTAYQPPLNPYTGGYGPTGNYGPGKSPFFSVANQFLPRNLHDVIRWARYITTQSPVVTEVIRKLSTYPITDFVIDTKNPGTKAKYEELIRSFNLKPSLHNIGFEYHTVGNVFVSVYFPIQRTLACPTPGCGGEHNALNASFAKFERYEFVGTCPLCLGRVTFKVKDSKSLDVKRMNLISWDPLNISVNHNPITNESEYYYKIPNDIRRRIQQGDKLLANTIPWQMVMAIKNNQDFKFERHAIFHLKNISAGHLISGVAVPPLLSQFTTVFYQTTLRKANESIASDFMTPLRVLFPQGQTSNSDPVVSLSLRNFAANMTQAVKNHRMDGNHVLVAPVPVGYETISGEGKTLLISQEIQQADQTLLLSMGVSLELLSGTTNWTSSTVGLRMLENTLKCYVDQIEHLVSWVFEQASKYLGLEVCPVRMTPFRLTDDEGLRQMLMGLASSGKASMATLFESFGRDYDDELERIKEEAVKTAISQVLTSLEIEKAQFIAAKSANGSEENDQEYKDALGRAQALAEQLGSADEGTIRRTLNELKVSDYGMYLMTAKLLEEVKNSNRAAAQDQAAVGGGQPEQPGQEGQAGAASGSEGEASPEGPEALFGRPAQPQTIGIMPNNLQVGLAPSGKTSNKAPASAEGQDKQKAKSEAPSPKGIGGPSTKPKK